jgi:5,10-methylenetetrahydromethanopterin reductase
VWNPFLRHPAQIAMDAGALDELAHGRLTLGIGSGLAAPIASLGVDNRRPIAALRDTFHIVRALLHGEIVTYKGKVFSVADVKLPWRPRRPDLPLLMAARGPQALALGGRVADGLLVSNMCPPGFTAYATQLVRAAAAEAGRGAPGRVVQYAPCVAKADRRQAIAELKPVLAGMLDTFWALAQRLMAARTSLVAHSGIPEADFAAMIARLRSGRATDDAIDGRFVEAFALAGTAEDCRARLAAYADAGVTDLVLTFVGADPVADMAYLAQALPIGRATGDVT